MSGALCTLALTIAAARPASADDARALEGAARCEALLAAARSRPAERSRLLAECSELARDVLRETNGDEATVTRLERARARAELAKQNPEAAAAALGGSGRALAAEDLVLRGRALIAAYRPEDARADLERALASEALPRAEQAGVLRDLARAELFAGRAREGAAARRSLEIEWSDGLGRALAAHATRRAALDLSEGDRRTHGLWEVTSLVGPDARSQAVARLEALQSKLDEMLPLPRRTARATRPTRVALLGPKAFATIRPGADARAFYHRDERAIYVLYEKPPEAARLLAHEAVHAHLHRLLEEAPAWLDEGLADELAPPVEASDLEPPPHPIRLRDVQVLLHEGRQTSLAELRRMDRVALYRPEGLREAFPYCWGYVHFLRLWRSGKYAVHLDAYVKALLGGAAEVEAYRFAFEGVDPWRLDAEAARYLGSLRP